MVNLIQLCRFIRVSCEEDTNTVNISVRLNVNFVRGAAVTAVLLTLVFRYGGISVGSVVQLLSDLFSLWPFLSLIVVAFLVLAAVNRRSVPGGDLRSKLFALFPKGVRGTALLCLVLLGLLVFVMWGAFEETMSEEGTNGPSERREPPTEWRSPPGEETPRLFREFQEGRR